MSSQKSVLFVLTSCDQLINGKGQTGFYLPEAAHPYYVLSPHFKLTFATPKGGVAPMDEGSAKAFAEDPDSKKFLNDPEAQQYVQKTLKLSDITVSDYDAVFYVGGHGPVIDLPVDTTSQKIIREFYESGKITSAVCHAPAVFRDVKLSNGDALIKGKKFTGFSNSEEEAVGATEAIPFLLETDLQKEGGIYSKASEDWGVHVVVDGTLLTGQNPNSAGPLAEEIKKALLK